MHLFRSFAAGALLAGTVSGCAMIGAGSASAVVVSPVAGGWEFDLTHNDTVWAHQNHVGAVIGGLPNPAAASFGQSLDALTDLASRYPQGRVSFTVFGPMDNLSGTMTALAN